jgi:hypothetical protein
MLLKKLRDSARFARVRDLIPITRRALPFSESTSRWNICFPMLMPIDRLIEAQMRGAQ